MEDLASAFQADFLDAVKVLEDFSSSDNALKDAMSEIRNRIASKKYVCAPNFWQDLRDTLGAIEQRRDERTGKTKVQQVLKQIARLEVKFWAKESASMLRELDPESRLERTVDWLQTFGSSDSDDDPSSGPAVLYQVLSDVTLQKDFDAAQREALSTAVRDNLHKFPVEMQAVLERVGSTVGLGVARGGLSDWRRRHQLTLPLEAPTVGPGAALLWPEAVYPGQLQAGMPGGPAQEASSLGGDAQALSLSALTAGPSAVDHPEGAEGLMSVAGEDENEATRNEAAEDEEAGGFEVFDVAQVDPGLLEQARLQVLKLLELNSEGCPKHFVRTRLKQVGIAGLPIAALGEGVFFSGADVYLRHPGAPANPLPQTGRLPVPEELRQQVVDLVKEAGCRLPIKQLAEKLQWQPGSARHSMHGPLRKALGQVPEVFFEPEKVFTTEVARKLVVLFHEEEEPIVDFETVETVPTSAVPYIADPFAGLTSTVMTWIHEADGTLDQNAVLPLIKALGFKTKSVIAALSNDVFWSHPEADCEILLRTSAGTALHPKPLPSNYLHEQVRRNLVTQVRQMGVKTKADKLAGSMGWNAKSELKRTYGTLRIVLAGLGEIFFEPSKLYLKRILDGVVEWPVGKDGRIGPGEIKEPIPQHWSRDVDDLRSAGDIDWFNVKRQLLGVAMSQGGRCDLDMARQILQPMEEVSLEMLFDPESKKYDLTKVLFWEPDRIFRRRAAAPLEHLTVKDAFQAPDKLEQLLIDAVKANGSATLAEMKAAVEASELSGEVDEQLIFTTAQRIPQLFFMPDTLFLRPVVNGLISEGPEDKAEMQLDEQDSFMLAGLAEVAAAAAAMEPLQLDPAGELAAAEKVAETPVQDKASAGSVTPGFFSFGAFEPSSKVLGAAAEPPLKRQRLAGAGGAAMHWGDEAPPWVTEGAAVMVRREQAAEVPGAIVEIHGSSCIVRLEIAGREVEEEFALPSLVPLTPEIGCAVKEPLRHPANLWEWLALRALCRLGGCHT
ncbi:unnamed protein product [Polarella glacialis]|uniref:Uncharacterized protein n=1 Tax=Polarella glacialis TaxID=89957 RepID=A0A813EYM6_POLGL|nr:unnamed protein product [Polarella glacialis]